MMGHSHAISGMTAWLAATSTAGYAMGHQTSATVVIGGSFVCAGAALLPDIDHQQATIAYSLPAVKVLGITVIPSPTKFIAKRVEDISGGHRHGTHSILGAIIFTLIALGADLIHVPVAGKVLHLASGALMLLMLAFALKALHVVGKYGAAAPWLIATAVAGYLTWFGTDVSWAWVWVSIATGVVMHDLGDFSTEEGVPLFWPGHPKPPAPMRNSFTKVFWGDNGYFRFPFLGHAGSWREHVLIGLATLYCLVILYYEAVGALGMDEPVFLQREWVHGHLWPQIKNILFTLIP